MGAGADEGAGAGVGVGVGADKRADEAAGMEVAGGR